MCRIREEVDRLLGNKSEIGYNDVNELKYTAAVFKESMRLYPPIPIFTRFTTDELQCGPYTLPKGTSIMVRVHSVLSFSCIIYPIYVA